jgi:hypothetical protein
MAEAREKIEVKLKRKLMIFGIIYHCSGFAWVYFIPQELLRVIFGGVPLGIINSNYSQVKRCILLVLAPIKTPFHACSISGDEDPTFANVHVFAV